MEKELTTFTPLEFGLEVKKRITNETLKEKIRLAYNQNHGNPRKVTEFLFDELQAQYMRITELEFHLNPIESRRLHGNPN